MIKQHDYVILTSTPEIIITLKRKHKKMIKWFIKNDFTELIEKITSIYDNTNNNIDITFQQPEQSQLVITITTPRDKITQIISSHNNQYSVIKKDTITHTTMTVKNVSEELIVEDMKKYLEFYNAYTDIEKPRKYSKLVKNMKFYKNNENKQ